MESKYDLRRLSSSCAPKRNKFTSRWWYDLFKVGRSDQGDNWFNQNTTWKVGTGEKIKFWEDEWLAIGQLKARYERIYNNSELKDKTIRSFGRWNTGRWEWKFSWRREWFEWEKSMVEDFMSVITLVSVQPEYDDVRLWNDPPSNTFSVKSAYNKLVNYRQGGKSVFGTLWNLKALPSALSFVWRTLSNRIATKQILYKRGMRLRDTSCALCGREEETSTHILLLCRESSEVWNMCFSWLGISSVNHNVLTNHLEQFYSICFNKEGNRLWKSLWVSIVWSIWKHRNRVTFIQAKVDAEEIFTMAQVQSWVWMKHKDKKVTFSFSYWILSPLTCINMVSR